LSEAPMGAWEYDIGPCRVCVKALEKRSFLRNYVVEKRTHSCIV